MPALFAEIFCYFTIIYKTLVNLYSGKKIKKLAIQGIKTGLLDCDSTTSHRLCFWNCYPNPYISTYLKTSLCQDDYALIYV